MHDTITRPTTRRTEPPPPDHGAAQIARLTAAVERLERRLDEFAGAYLNARFPYGDGRTDRWGRRR